MEEEREITTIIINTGVYINQPTDCFRLTENLILNNVGVNVIIKVVWIDVIGNDGLLTISPSLLSFYYQMTYSGAVERSKETVTFSPSLITVSEIERADVNLIDGENL